jgi:hypothetical protein
MRTLMAPFTWFGRVLLWIFLLPVGIWRSLRHHRKKGERKTLVKIEKMMEERERKS